MNPRWVRHNKISVAIYGAGLQFNVTNNVGIRAEYTRIASDADQVNLGVNYKF